MTRNELINYWISSSEQDYNTMKHLYDSHDYHWSLFMGHLVLEKILKAVYIAKVDNEVPRVHDLLRLCEKIGLDPSDEQTNQLDLITTFNIAARYPDYKQSFYFKCTREYTTKNISVIEELRRWLLSMVG